MYVTSLHPVSMDHRHNSPWVEPVSSTGESGARRRTQVPLDVGRTVLSGPFGDAGKRLGYKLVEVLSSETVWDVDNDQTTVLESETETAQIVPSVFMSIASILSASSISPNNTAIVNGGVFPPTQ